VTTQIPGSVAWLGLLIDEYVIDVSLSLVSSGESTSHKVKGTFFCLRGALLSKLLLKIACGYCEMVMCPRHRINEC
jgi:hypothetical protein